MMCHGANLLPENLETGEYKIGGTAEIDDLEPYYVVAYADDTYGHLYNGIFSGINFYAYSDPALLRAFLLQVNQAGHTDYILNIFTVPKLALNGSPNGILDTDFTASGRNVSLTTLPSSLDGYTPKNQKLRTYPFIYLGFNPSGGSSAIYRYEDFTNATPTFKLISEVNPNPVVAVIPQNYRGMTGDNMADIGTIQGYPTISWSNDVFNTWLAQNKEIVKLQTEQETANWQYDQISNLTNMASNTTKGAMKGDILGLISGTVSTGLDYARSNTNYDYFIKNQMAQIEKQRKLPNTANFGSSNATLIGYSLFDKNIFSRYTIKRQFAERIDKFFDMYGYLTNQVKIPNLNNRTYWNYIKTIGANIIGNIPQNDLQTFKDIFDNGVTLWHNPNTFLDYSQNNRT